MSPYLKAPAVRPLMSCRENKKYMIKTGSMESVSAAIKAVQSVWYCPTNTWAPNVTVLVALLGARIRGNHRSLQVGIIVKTATVAIAGRTSGKMSQKIWYSLAPSTRPASFNSCGT